MLGGATHAHMCAGKVGVHIHACVYTRTHACTHTHSHTRTHAHARTHARMHTHSHMCTHAHARAHACTRTRARTHAHTHTHTHTHKQTCIHTHARTSTCVYTCIHFHHVESCELEQPGSYFRQTCCSSSFQEASLSSLAAGQQFQDRELREMLTTTKQLEMRGKPAEVCWERCCVCACVCVLHAVCMRLHEHACARYDAAPSPSWRCRQIYVPSCGP